MCQDPKRVLLAQIQVVEMITAALELRRDEMRKMKEDDDICLVANVMFEETWKEFLPCLTSVLVAVRSYAEESDLSYIFVPWWENFRNRLLEGSEKTRRPHIVPEDWYEDFMED